MFCHLQHTMLQRAGVAAPEQEMVVCILDNRGVGNSSSPVKQQAYSTTLMAQDALAVMVRRSRSFSLEGGVLQAGAWWAAPCMFPAAQNMLHACISCVAELVCMGGDTCCAHTV
jgi:hypothetical protein